MPSLYTTIQTIKNSKGKSIYNQIYYPDYINSDDDYYIITSNIDRYDLIAFDFWGDETLWRILPIINELECDSFYPPIGIQLKIPKNPTEYLNLFNKENEIL